MNETIPSRWYALAAAVVFLAISAIHDGFAVDALLLQDTYVVSGRANPNFGTSSDLRGSSTRTSVASRSPPLHSLNLTKNQIGFYP